MAVASFNGTQVAASSRTVQVEGNHYFPLADVNQAVLQPSPTTTECAWKGTAHYYDVVVDGEVARDAAWYYPDPKPEASKIKNHVAFWKGVRVH